MNDDPLRPHVHDPNLEVPVGDGSFELVLGNGRVQTITVKQLKALAYTQVENCFIVSTGHGTSGPFTFGGVSLHDFVNHFVKGDWRQLEVVSVDGFGNRVLAKEANLERARPILLAYQIDGMMMSREAGLVRMIVPQETDDALRQVKWIGQIRVV